MKCILIVAIKNERYAGMQATGDRDARYPANLEPAPFSEDLPLIDQDGPWNSVDCKDKKHTAATLASDLPPLTHHHNLSVAHFQDLLNL